MYLELNKENYELRTEFLPFIFFNKDLSFTTLTADMKLLCILFSFSPGKLDLGLTLNIMSKNVCSLYQTVFVYTTYYYNVGPLSKISDTTPEHFS